MAGWIKIHRDITTHWIFQDAEKLKWWIDMLFLASYEDNKTIVKNQIAEIKRGQFIGSLSFFVKRWGASKERVINFLRLLQSEGMIDKKSDKNITLVTICNYESYQDVSDNLPDNKPYHNPDNLPDNLPDTTKEIKEIKEYYNNTNSAYACEEDGYIARYKKEGMWADVALILHKKIPECQNLFEMFIVEYQHNGYTHRDYSDFKRHFIQWARIAVQKEPTIEQPKEKKVISNEEILKMMQG